MNAQLPFPRGILRFLPGEIRARSGYLGHSERYLDLHPRTGRRTGKSRSARHPGKLWGNSPAAADVVDGQPSWVWNIGPRRFVLIGWTKVSRIFQESSGYLTALVKELKPDLLHLNQLCYGSLPVAVPRVVVAHGDVLTWWKAVHGREPKRIAGCDGIGMSSREVWRWPVSPWLLARGCVILSAIATPAPQYDTVIYNGRNPIFFNPYVGKDDSVLAVGKLLDAGKQVSLLTQHRHPLPVCIVGSDMPIHGPSRTPIRADVKLAVDEMNVALKGPQTEVAAANALQPGFDLCGHVTLRTFRYGGGGSRVLALRDRGQ